MNSYDGVQSQFTVPKRTVQGHSISQIPGDFPGDVDKGKIVRKVGAD